MKILDPRSQIQNPGQAQCHRPYRDLGSWIWDLGFWVLGLGLAAVLGWRAFEAHRANAQIYRRLCSEDDALARVSAERARLRAERQALEKDPAYVEALLRRLRFVEHNEKIVEALDARTSPRAAASAGETEARRRR